MTLEIEIKVKVQSLDQIRAKLQTSGAKLISEQDEHDTYYNAPHKDFAITDEALRVRCISNPKCTNISTNVTYKGSNIGHDGFKSREEIIVDISSFNDFNTILNRLNFKKTADIYKHREMYRCNQVIVALDNVKELGYFVEIEADANLNENDAMMAINNMASIIGITGKRLTKSYLEIYLLTKTGNKL
ncbi:MAG TPA: class IV adenylate cyclase [Methanocorpusculum sp.]|nr:class IV adenylate cyclase [Methanocorpusculum sp.]